MKSNSGTKASILYLLATLLNKGIAFLTVPIFTRLLSTSDYGIITTYNSWVDILTVVMSLALYMAIRVSFVDYKRHTKEFLNTVVTFTCLISTVAGIIVIMVGRVFQEINITLLLFAVIQGAASAILMDYTQYLMMNLEYVKRAFYMAFPNFFGVIFSIIVIFSMKESHLYMGRIVPTMCVYVIFGIMILIRVYSFQKPQINGKYLKYGLAVSLPLVLHGIALNILSQSDRTMITLLADASQTGIYSLVYNFGMIATVITTAMEGVWVPWFMKMMKERNFVTINSRAVDYVKLMTYAMIGIILAGPEILKFLASKDYWEGINIIPPVVLSNYFIFIYSLYVNIEHFYKKTLGITTNTIIAAVCNIILNYVLIPKFGYIAAAYTTLISYILALLLHAKCGKSLEKELYPISVFLKPFILILFTAIMYYCFLECWIVRWLLLAYIFAFVILKEKCTIRDYINNG